MRFRAGVLLAARFRGFRRSVEESRENLGRLLARECPADADLVVPVPDSGVAAAIGYSAESGFPSARLSFATTMWAARLSSHPGHPRFRSQAEAESRALLTARAARGVGGRLHRARHDEPKDRPAWCGKRCAREVHLRISCPPTVSPCFYGVDTPTRSELIGSDHNVEEIRRFVEADSLGYLSLASLRQAVGDDRHEYCYACYTGDYPTELSISRS